MELREDGRPLRVAKVGHPDSFGSRRAHLYPGKGLEEQFQRELKDAR